MKQRESFVTDEEARIEYQQLVGLLDQVQLSWLRLQVERYLRFGKSEQREVAILDEYVEEHDLFGTPAHRARRGPKANFLLTVEYTSQERLQVLAAAIVEAVPHVLEMANAVPRLLHPGEGQEIARVVVVRESETGEFEEKTLQAEASALEETRGALGALHRAGVATRRWTFHRQPANSVQELQSWVRFEIKLDHGKSKVSHTPERPTTTCERQESWRPLSNTLPQPCGFGRHAGSLRSPLNPLPHRRVHADGFWKVRRQPCGHSSFQQVRLGAPRRRRRDATHRRLSTSTSDPARLAGLSGSQAFHHGRVGTDGSPHKAMTTCGGGRED